MVCAIATVSVTSSVRLPGGALLSERMRSTRSGKPGSTRERAETFTATEKSGRAGAQRARSRIACSIIRQVMRVTWLLVSARVMNSRGPSSPRVGWRQRTRLSQPTGSMLRRQIFGW